MFPLSQTLGTHLSSPEDCVSAWYVLGWDPHTVGKPCRITALVEKDDKVIKWGVQWQGHMLPKETRSQTTKGACCPFPLLFFNLEKMVKDGLSEEVAFYYRPREQAS